MARVCGRAPLVFSLLKDRHKAVRKALVFPRQKKKKEIQTGDFEWLASNGCIELYSSERRLLMGIGNDRSERGGEKEKTKQVQRISSRFFFFAFSTEKLFY